MTYNQKYPAAIPDARRWLSRVRYSVRAVNAQTTIQLSTCVRLCQVDLRNRRHPQPCLNAMIRAKLAVCGMKVMLDFDLAEIYGYTTTAFNQQVKNNAAKFEGEDFMFQLTREELNNLISKNLTSSWGGRRKLPNCFTESGIYMLMTVLRGDLAIQQSRALIRAFRAMKDYMTTTAIRWATPGSPCLERKQPSVKNSDSPRQAFCWPDGAFS